MIRELLQGVTLEALTTWVAVLTAILFCLLVSLALSDR